MNPCSGVVRRNGQQRPCQRGEGHGGLHTAKGMSDAFLECQRSPLRAVSPKRRQQLRAYRPLRDAFLDANPWCQSPARCGRPSACVHHRRGREGDRLIDVTWWAASCGPCNDRAEWDTGWARATGWLVDLDSKAEVS